MIQFNMDGKLPALANSPVDGAVVHRPPASKAVSIHYDIQSHLLLTAAWMAVAATVLFFLFYYNRLAGTAFSSYASYRVRAWVVLALLLVAGDVWRYSRWARGNKAYIRFDDHAITLLGDCRIPWSSIEYVMVRDLPLAYPAGSKLPGAGSSCLILGLSYALQQKFDSIRHLDELTRANPLISSSLGEQIEELRGGDLFLSLRVSPSLSSRINRGVYARLDHTPAEIGAFAEAFFRRARESRPRCLDAAAAFPHKDAVLAAFEAGASCVRDSHTVTAPFHAGVYAARLKIARDRQLNPQRQAEAAAAAADFEFFLAKLGDDPGADTRTWHMTGPGGQHYTLIENEATGEALGCLSGRIQPHE